MAEPVTRAQGKANVVLLALSSFLVGAGLTGYWLHRSGTGASGAAAGINAAVPRAAGLTEQSRAVLARLKAPVELRCYSLLDPETTPEPLKAFARRVVQWAAEYERESGGKIKTALFQSLSYSNANAAVRDGLKPFNAEKGDASFLGMALVLDGHRESLPQLAPEWEAALESDVTRAIARLLEATRPAPAPAVVSQAQSNATEDVKALIPDISAVSLEEGTRILREAALRELQDSAKETESRLKEAEQKITDAQNQPEAEQAAARKFKQQVQAEQVAKFKAVAAKSQAQIEALLRLKSEAQ